MRHILLKVDYETARRDVASGIKPGKRTSTRVDLPLSYQAKRVLAYAADEAESLNHRHIGSEHLLLGLMRDNEFAAAEFLSKFGTNLEALRKRVEALGDPARRESVPRHFIDAHRRSPSLPGTIEIHGVKRNIEHIHILLSSCREQAWRWEQKPWKARDIVIKKDSKALSLDLTLAERSPDEFALVPGGWKKDHCAICHWELLESDDASHDTGFTNSKDWVCTECHERFIAGDFFSSPYSDIT